jgi:hypothetical protein
MLSPQRLRTNEKKIEIFTSGGMIAASAVPT